PSASTRTRARTKPAPVSPAGCCAGLLTRTAICIRATLPLRTARAPDTPPHRPPIVESLSLHCHRRFFAPGSRHTAFTARCSERWQRPKRIHFLCTVPDIQGQSGTVFFCALLRFRFAHEFGQIVLPHSSSGMRAVPARLLADGQQNEASVRNLLHFALRNSQLRRIDVVVRRVDPQ